jgi:lysozyme family protein
VHEGGYSNHPSDPGGPTNWGITIFDYRRYVNPAATAADVRSMPVEVAKKIYRDKYWNAMRCDELPPGVDYCIFDYGVNSGIGRAPRILRRLLGLPEQPATVTGEVIAAAARDPKALIDAICDERLAFLRSLRTWDVFGNGWGRRVREVRAAALAIAREDGRERPDVLAPGSDRGPSKLAPGPDRGTLETKQEAGQAANQANAQATSHETPRAAADEPSASIKGRRPPMPAAKKLGWGAVAVAAVAAAAHWLDAHPLLTIAGVVLAALVAVVVISNPTTATTTTTTTTTTGRSRPS